MQGICFTESVSRGREGCQEYSVGKAGGYQVLISSSANKVGWLKTTDILHYVLVIAISKLTSFKL